MKEHEFISRRQWQFCILTDRYFLVSPGHSRSLGLISGAKVSLVGLLKAVAVGVEAAGRVVLTGLRTPLRWRLYLPHEVEIVLAVPSGWAVYIAPPWRNEWVGLVWWHKQIWNHKSLLDKMFLVLIRSGNAHRATSLGQVK